MPAMGSRGRDHQIAFSGLEVLPLIGDWLDSRIDVDGDDIDAVLGCRREVAHACLDSTEELLGTHWPEEIVMNHRRARALLEDLSGALAGTRDECGALCHAYTTLVCELILEERRSLSSF